MYSKYSRMQQKKNGNDDAEWPEKEIWIESLGTAVVNFSLQDIIPEGCFESFSNLFNVALCPLGVLY